ncbi:serine hydrolase [Sphingomicrobium nitratireducens]|uniref:serine hydrolase n=1 Tax=Sphingomicrobium nitratireducens TaxID=2964666 RepID=UPI002240A110|nr:serine hydrolase [Sphingomicrobium nitratireducens]
MTSRVAFIPLFLGLFGIAEPAPLPVAAQGLSPTPAAQPYVAPRPEIEALNAQLLERVRSFNGTSGIAIKSIDEGWEAGWREDRLFPQQSVSKLWVTLTALDKADKGEIDLSKRVTIGRDDLTLWSSGTAARVLKSGWTTSLDNLMHEAITKSDNHANDKLMWSVGGPDAVRAMIAEKGLGAIRFYNGERALQSKIAGLTWQQSYSVGNNFSRARASVPDATRRQAFEAYVSDPYDGAAPIAIARALARLENGELLSPASTAKLLTTMGMTSTGKLRVRAGLKPGWTWNHKTGTGQNYRGRVGGLNDIGILTAPDGKSYAVAVMTVPSTTDGSAQELMRDVAKMVIDYHERYGSDGFQL